MKFKKKMWSALASAAIAALALSGCSGSADEPSASDNTEVPFETVTDGKLTVAFYDLMPKIALKDDNTLDGVEGWLLTGLAEKYGLEVVPMRTDFAGMLLAVQQGKADIGANIYYSEERGGQVNYTLPVVNDVFGFIMPADTDYSGPESLKGGKIGTLAGYVYNDVISEYFGEGNIVILPDAPTMIAAVKNGQIAAYAGSSGSASAAIKENPDLKLEPVEEGAMGLPEDVRLAPAYEITSCKNLALADAASDFIKEKAESGELDAQFEPWGLNGEPFKPELTRPAQGCK